jgi:hypothetical protein
MANETDNDSATDSVIRCRMTKLLTTEKRELNGSIVILIDVNPRARKILGTIITQHNMRLNVSESAHYIVVIILTFEWLIHITFRRHAIKSHNSLQTVDRLYLSAVGP